ncbi:MAG TPA: glycosyltransferase family 9 protein [Candidatus Binatia bacterium]
MKHLPSMELESTVKRCVIFPGALGDFVCFLPALRFLSAGGDVDLFARSEFAAIAPGTVRVHSIERYEIARLFAAGAANEDRILRFFRGYSGLYSWHGSHAVEFAGAVKSLFGEHGHVFPFYPTVQTMHQADYYQSCVCEGKAPRLPPIRIRPDSMAWAADYLRHHGLEKQPILGIAPGSGAREKNWPAEYFSQVAEWWREEVCGAVILFLGPVEEERTELRRLRKKALIAENLPLDRLAALLRTLDVYLGNDSGVTHLAAAAGVSTMALFGPSAVARWAPRGPRVSVITQNVDCSPCSRAVMKSCEHHRCLATLAPSQVIRSLKNVWSEPNLTREKAATRV